MAIISLPYTFVGGTRAIADQVNADFNAVANGINNNVIAQLQANPTNFYVNGGTGNDSNTGLTPNTAFATLQGASNVIGFLNLNGVQVVVNIAPGTYDGFAWGGPVIGQYSPQQVIFRGNTANPADVTVGPGRPGSGDGQCVFVLSLGLIQLEGMRFVNPTGDALGFTGNALWVQGGGQLNWQLCDFGPCSPAVGTHVIAEDFAVANCVGAYTISGGAGNHYFIGGQGQLNVGAVSGTPLPVPPFQVTLSGTPAFPGGFCYCTGNSLADFGGTPPTGGSGPVVTYSGAATGPRFYVDTCSVIQTYQNGGNLNFFPGNAPGNAVATTFGVYL